MYYYVSTPETEFTTIQRTRTMNLLLTFVWSSDLIFDFFLFRSPNRNLFQSHQVAARQEGHRFIQLRLVQ